MNLCLCLSLTFFPSLSNYISCFVLFSDSFLFLVFSHFLVSYLYLSRSLSRSNSTCPTFLNYSFEVRMPKRIFLVIFWLSPATAQTCVWRWRGLSSPLQPMESSKKLWVITIGSSNWLRLSSSSSSFFSESLRKSVKRPKMD